MPKFGVSTFKPVPFLRILLPFCAGILVQFHLHISSAWLYATGLAGCLLIIFPRFLKLPDYFVFRWVAGTGFNLLFAFLGGFIVISKYIENDLRWVGNHYQQGAAVIVTIQEPLVDKPRSYKALARIETVVVGDTATPVKGDVLIYFQKDSLKPALQYGSQLLIRKRLQPITNSGNPGGFDYKRYCAFQDIHYQAFLKPADYVVLNTFNTNWFNAMLIDTRTWVLNTLRSHIKEKNEVAVAEALLIGYRDDLDKELVQSYSNTGVVHIIAISGLHLGMIYGALVWLFAPFKKRRWCNVAKPLTILFVLWIFTFIAGAVPSILRSAVMFTCIILGESLSKRTSIYNTLAASAFLLLLYNPFYLWDVGFQLSYSAVLSIVVFQKLITRWLYFRNKILYGIWRMCAISLAAQVLTLPIVLYHFHQFPNLFLLTNLIVVPLSGIILFAEIILLIVSFAPFIAQPFGRAIEWSIWLMNSLIERTDRIPFAVTDGIQLTIVQTIFIYATIVFIAYWLTRKQKPALFAAGLSLLAYVALRSIDLIRVNQQQKLIVYNVPQHTAIDIIEGGSYWFYGDTALTQEGFLRNFHLRPSRIMNRITAGSLSTIRMGQDIIESPDKKVIILNAALPKHKPAERIRADAIIITGNPKLYMDELVRLYDCNLLIFDATNPPWKIRLWKKDCDNLHLRHYSVPEQGAFEMNL